MNIKDVDNAAPPEHVEDDRLSRIFKRQHELMVKYVEIERANGVEAPTHWPLNLDLRPSQQYIKDMTWRVVEELGEAMNCLKNKPWKQTAMLTDTDHFYEELADALHFFVELLILVGMGPEEVYDLYFRKSEVNLFRQRSKY